MLNFYRRFLADIAKTLTPINELLYRNIRGKTSILWSTKTEEAFEKSKESLAKTTLLVHPKMNVELFTNIVQIYNLRIIYKCF